MKLLWIKLLRTKNYFGRQLVFFWMVISGGHRHQQLWCRMRPHTHTLLWSRNLTFRPARPSYNWLPECSDTANSTPWHPLQISSQVSSFHNMSVKSQRTPSSVVGLRTVINFCSASHTLNLLPCHLLGTTSGVFAPTFAYNIFFFLINWNSLSLQSFCCWKKM